MLKIQRRKKRKKLYYQDKQAKLAKKEGWIYYPPSDSEEKDIMKENKVEKNLKISIQNNNESE